MKEKIITHREGNFDVILSDTGKRNKYYTRMVPKGLADSNLYPNGIKTAPTWTDVFNLIESILESEKRNGFPPKLKQMDAIVDIFKKYGYDEQDMLGKIFFYQHSFQEKLGIYDKISDPALKQAYVNQMILALHEEATEIMRESAYKNPELVPFGWKKGQKWNEENFKNEIVDIIHFIVNLSLAVGMDASEMYNRYYDKNKENIKRQDDNY